MHVERWRQWKEFSSCGCCGSFYMSSPDNAKSTINTARRQRLTEEFAPFLTIYYYLSQFIDCPCCDSSIVATVVQCWQLKSPPTDRLSLAAFVVDFVLSGHPVSGFEVDRRTEVLMALSLIPTPNYLCCLCIDKYRAPE